MGGLSMLMKYYGGGGGGGQNITYLFIFFYLKLVGISGRIFPKEYLVEYSLNIGLKVIFSLYR